MAIKVNGKLVAGLGKSAYEQAQEGGYTGTEEEFISALANIGSNPTAEGLPVNDVRTGTVRDGQSIAAGDVVNARALGKTVAIQWNGKPALFRVVQVGNPDPSIYDASCDGIWVMAVDRSINMVFGSNNDYKSSNVHAWCNGDFINGFEPEMREKIKTVKIPYWDGTGTEGSLKNGAEGLSTKGFILSLEEFNHTLDGVRSIGDALSAFTVDVPQTLSTYFVCRNPSASNNTQVASLHTGNQTPQIIYSATQTLAITPCFILPLDTDLSTIGTVVEDNYDVYRDVVAQKNVENVFAASAVTATDIISLNENYAVCAFVKSDGTFVGLIERNTGKATGSVHVTTSVATSVSLARLDDTLFVLQYIINNYVYVRVFAVSEATISSKGDFSIASNITSDAGCLVSLSSDTLISVFNKSALTVRLIKWSGIAINLVGSEKNLPTNTGANCISATRIPDDDSGNKRVCICFSDTGDGNKGKAVIATVDSANAVTFGEVSTFIDNGSVTATHCASDSAHIVVIANIGTKILDFSLAVVSDVSLGHSTTSVINLSDNQFIFINGGGMPSSARTLSITNEQGALGNSFVFNTDASLRISACKISDNKVLAAYADVGNSNHGTTTILEIFGNQIAGSFLNNSKDAIALESGEGGDTIKLGFGGYCACEGITAGQTIDSEGVTAYSPLDGWLKIIPWQEQAEPEIAPYVVGEYTGTGGKSVEIDVGFVPKLIIVKCISVGFTSEIRYGFLLSMPTQGNTPGSYYISPTYLDNNKTVSVNATSGTTVRLNADSLSATCNHSGALYRYIAFR